MAKYLLILLLISQCAYSQSNSEKKSKESEPCDMKKYEDDSWKEGFVLLPAGDTLRGKIKIEKDPKIAQIYPLQNSIVFVSERTCRLVYYPADLRSYSFLQVDLKTYSTFVSLPAKFQHTEHLDHIFVRQMTSGRCSIFKYQTIEKDATSQFEKANLGSIVPRSNLTDDFVVYHDCIKKENGELIEITKVGFQNKMKKYFASCPAIQDGLKNKKFKFDIWKQMVAFYNESCK